MSIRILLAEDEANIAEYLVVGLREEGYTVEHAADGIVATQRLQSEAWDLVLLDWSLPYRDGLEVLRLFRVRERRTPVLFLTARDQIQYRVLGLDEGADDYLCKPFDFEELLARVRALIRRGEKRTDTLLALGDVTIDLASQRAARAGRPLEFTSKELAVLIYFLRHPGRVLSRALIYEHVWNEPYDAHSNTLEMHIVELRRKLEAIGPRVIHTVRGRGYCFGEAPGDGPEHQK
jgi:two-component system copper resistance phosphate regulon response regulator CusR